MTIISPILTENQNTMKLSPSDLPDFSALFDKLRESEQYIPNNPTNRASLLGEPCLRKLFYYRTAHTKQTPLPVDAMYRFKEGREQEKIILKDLEKIDFPVHKQQYDFFDERYNLSGHIEGTIKIGDEYVPIEIKSVDPNIWNRINSYEDIHNNKWMKRYISQVQIYMFLTNKEIAIMFLKNKSSGRIKNVIFGIDYELCEQLLQKCETIEAHIKEKKTPEPYLSEDCESCCFREHCCPELLAKSPLDFLNLPEIQTMLIERESHKEAGSIYNSVDRKVKEKLKKYVPDNTTVVIGDFMVTVKNRRFKIDCLTAGKTEEEEILEDE